MAASTSAPASSGAGATAASRAAAFAARVEKLSRTDGDAHRVELAYRIALSRPPTATERRLGIAALQQLRRDWNGGNYFLGEKLPGGS